MNFIYIGGIILIVGVIYKLFPPRTKNWVYGWRSNFAMKNEDTWNEAQRYGANLFILAGLILTALGFLMYISSPNAYKDMRILIYIVLIGVIIMGEVHLRKVFDYKGKRK